MSIAPSHKSFKQSICYLLSFLLLIPAALAHDIDITQLVRQNSASVVSVRGIISGGSNQPNTAAPFHDFFPFSPNPFEAPERGPRRQPSSSAGSGFIISPDGYILTNAHVVAGADEVIITLSDDREFPAEIVGSDEKTDVALLKIDAGEQLTEGRIGDSDTLQVGEPVLAIGSPYGLDQTVTSGIISALGRRLPNETYIPFIQTDAAVNPGNSGGPLMNGKGEIIGINSQIISPVRSFSGVSFAIPINDAMDIQQKLLLYGEVERAQLGIYFTPVTQAIAEAYSIEKNTGALIQDIIKNSPAEKAGLQSGDILVAFNGEKITDGTMLPRLVGNTEPGKDVTLGVLRDGETIEIQATLTALSNKQEQSVLGLKVENLTEEQSRRSGISEGVIIASIEREEDTPRDINQLRPGDIITHVLINKRRQPIDNRDTFTTLLSDFNSGAIALSVWREGRRLIIPVRING